MGRGSACVYDGPSRSIVGTWLWTRGVLTKIYSVRTFLFGLMG